MANETTAAVEAKCHFRVQGLRPELWNPETGEISPLAVYKETAAGISVPLRLEGERFDASWSFARRPKPFDPVVSFTRDGQPVRPMDQAPVIKIQKAIYGVPGDAARTRDVSSKVQALVDGGELRFQVSQLAQGDDPAYGTVKTLVMEYTADRQQFTVSGRDPDTISLNSEIILTTGAARVPGLTGEYFANPNLSGKPVVVRTDAGVNFAWNSGSPGSGNTGHRLVGALDRHPDRAEIGRIRVLPLCRRWVPVVY